MNKPRYIRRKGSKHIHEWSELLADSPDMVECDANGNPVVPAEAVAAATAQTGLNTGAAPETPDAPPPPPDQPPTTITISKGDLESASRETMFSLVKQLNLKVHPSTGDDKIRAAISAVLFPED